MANGITKITYSALCAKIALRTGLTWTQARDVTRALAEIVTESAQNGEEVTVDELGRFIGVKRSARNARAQGGQLYKVPEKLGLKFYAAASVNRALSEGMAK